MSLQTDFYAEFRRSGGPWQAACKHGGWLEQFPNRSFMRWLDGRFDDQLGPPPNYFSGLPDDLCDEVRYAVEEEEWTCWLWFDDLRDRTRQNKGNPDYFSWFEQHILKPIETLDLGSDAQVRLILGNG